MRSKSKSSSSSEDMDLVTYIRANVDYINGLSTQPLRALSDWSGGGSMTGRPICAPTETHGIYKVSLDKFRSYTYPLMKILYHAPKLQSQRTFYRGMRLNYVPAPGSLLRHRMNPTATTLIPSAYMYSVYATVNRYDNDAADKHCIIMEIKLPRGVSGIYLDSHIKLDKKVATNRVWSGNDEEFELLLGFYDFVIKDVKHETMEEDWQKPCNRLVCEVQPTDIYIVKKQHTIYLACPNHCLPGEYEAFTAGCKVYPWIVNDKMKELPF